MKVLILRIANGNLLGAFCLFGGKSLWFCWGYAFKCPPLHGDKSLLTVKSARGSDVWIRPGEQSAAGVLWGNPGNLF